MYSYKAFNTTIENFSNELPKLLSYHSLTSDLALQLQSYNLGEAFKERFNVAIMGQMRVGKSMLLNALIGKDLAPVGVEETTATVNWFRYGKGDRCVSFRVNWDDGSSEDLPLDKVSEWLGQSKNIMTTRSLDFYAETEFLKTANLIDTPGTRSVIGAHENTTQGFLAEELEKTSLKFGGRADAVIYAINPVARENDEKLLQLFGENTRIPGSSAFNSIAVVQKWEHLMPDPLIEVEKKCLKLRQLLDGKVAHVIPTSGLLAYISRTASGRVLDLICKLIINTNINQLENLVRFDDDFIEEDNNICLTVGEREEILHEISFAVLPLILFESKKRDCKTAEQIRTLLLDLSGLPKLHEILKTNFFSRSWLIKANTALRKVWEPADISLIRLENAIDQKNKLRRLGKSALQKLPENSDYSDLRQFIERADSSINHEVEKMREVSTKIDALKYQAKKAFQLFEGDMIALESLQRLKSMFTGKEVEELTALFGANGSEMADRLNINGNVKSSKELITAAEDLHDFFYAKMHSTNGDQQKVYEHAVTVLGYILNELEGR